MYYVLRQSKLYLQKSVLAHKAYLLPLRIFLALGWLRASVEKVVSPHWASGQSLESFLTQALIQTPFGFYQFLINTFFLPNTEFLSFFVAALQGAIGLSLLFGAASQLALLVGIFLNLNFILAGVVNPSAFYIMIELVLLMGHAGAVLGFDAYLSGNIKKPWLIAQKKASQSQSVLQFQRGRNLFLIVIIAIFSLIDFFYIRSFSPEASVEDPAMLLYVLAIFAILQLVICSLQIQQRLETLEPSGNIFRLKNVS